MQKNEQCREKAVIDFTLFCNFNLISIEGDWKKDEQIFGENM